MVTWLARRVLVSAVSFIGITFVLYWLVIAYAHSLPFSTSTFSNYSFVRSPFDQYRAWLVDFLTGGGASPSIITGRPAVAMVLERVPPTLLLMGSALLLQVTFGVSLGVLAALHAHRFTDRVISVAAAGANAAPPYLTALIAIFLFAVTLRVLPAGEMFTAGRSHPDLIDYVRHLILPASVLATIGVGRVIRYTRTGLLDALSADYIVTARAKGLGLRAAAIRHALPNALLPVITLIGLQVSVLIGGSFLVEIVFNWPGLGRVAFDAITASPHDFPVLLAFGAVCAVGVLVGGLLADVGYFMADPVLRSGQLGGARRSDEGALPTPLMRALGLVALALVVSASSIPADLERALYAREHPGQTSPPTTCGYGSCAVAQPYPTLDVSGFCIQIGGKLPCPSFTAAPAAGATRVASPSPGPARTPRPSVRPTPFLADAGARVVQVMAGLPGGAGAPDAPGCAVAISALDRVVFQRGFGLADLATATPITPTTVFDVASVSKQFTAAAILLLVGEGKVFLGEDIHRYVPELPHYDQPLTLAELMYHRSGLPFLGDAIARQGFVTDAEVEAMNDADLSAVLRSLTSLDYPPGSMYQYGDTEYDLLRLVVQRVSGMAFEDYLRTRFFEPLGMSATFVDRHPELPVAGKATPYGRTSSAITRWTVEDRPTLGWDIGAADVQTTVLDLLRWAANFDTGSVGGQALLRAQVTPGGDDGNLDYAGQYAAGLHLWVVDGRHLVWHDGGAEGSGFRAALTMDPADHAAVALTCNTNTFAPHLLSFLILEAWLGVPTSIAPSDLPR